MQPTTALLLPPCAAALLSSSSQLRLDAKIPGTVLLRDKNGGVFYITIDNVQQVRDAHEMVLQQLLLRL